MAGKMSKMGAVNKVYGSVVPVDKKKKKRPRKPKK